ncbi:Right handed beta helix region [Paenibacillus sp. 1_12]|uniref:glycosyl hydrolase family 28-related protein n=1 Tax=Paenibacillus sp. 1_12 TaxID=1566278 RepID=UPI0008E375B5|nr:glycosyl hydrolase family 28-related protein [Paenibacillus sp. 1_12]SFL47466.1 Right handed beta helix region [Paenibacillus sp. 1_12]
MLPLEPTNTDKHTNKPITRRKLLASLSAAGVLLATGAGFTGEAQAAVTVPVVNTNTWWYNVKDFGAQGNDRNDQDDSPFIQAAINAAAITGGTVYLPAGKYMIKTGLFLRSKVHLLGAGVEASILKAGLVNMQMVTCSSQVKQASVEGLTFEGIGSVTSSVTTLVERGIHILESSFIRISKCLFKGIANGVHLVRSEHVTVQDCSFISILAGTSVYEGYGVTAEGGANHSIQGNHFKSMSRSCIQLTAGCSYSLVAGNVMEACLEGAITLSSKLSVCMYNVIKGNTVTAFGLIDKETSCTYGIRLKDACSYNHIVNNSVTRSTFAGIQLEAVDNAGDDRPYGNVITGNKIDTSVRGIAVLNGTVNSLMANEVRRVELGILIDTTGEGNASIAKQNVVTGNSLFQCSTSAVKIGSARCQSNMVHSNSGFDNGAGLSDSGTDTVTVGF